MVRMVSRGCLAWCDITKVNLANHIERMVARNGSHIERLLQPMRACNCVPPPFVLDDVAQRTKKRYHERLGMRTLYMTVCCRSRSQEALNSSLSRPFSRQNSSGQKPQQLKLGGGGGPGEVTPSNNPSSRSQSQKRGRPSSQQRTSMSLPRAISGKGSAASNNKWVFFYGVLERFPPPSLLSLLCL